MSTPYRHGVSLGFERVGSDFFLSFKAIGKLTHQDYQYITPLIESALNSVEPAKMNVFFDCSDFQGWELKAAWDDLKLGLKHGSAFNKIAIYSNQENNRQWLEYSSKIASWFTSGNVEFFDQETQAFNWLQGSH
ncbi:STAS/SEC14 domain-containing protein [Dasania marina]|uniref:STAS/SEC14 domain-containing protein n=1 Tax=Dasania marina TaxID=471499 RepID=UPI00036902A7|nr:STAS/SEC14 domain-containing protein [Dasania marina]